MIHYERRASAALVTIDRPERHNAVDGATAAALLAAFERFCADDSAAVMVLTGAGGALAIGLLTRVVDDSLAGALALAEEISAFPQDTARSDRQAALEGFGMPLEDGLALEARLGRDRLRTAHDGAARFSDRPR